ncbi:MAG: NAD(P)H-dependent oxidoreductase, partial [Alphaproteobacteria bacterium]|nr:NAD(P)H-dependent oxidoreductase [Alphaproteobacteria bacterium]
MKALVLNCTLKPSPASSSTEALARVVIAELEKGGAEVEMIRLVDLNLRPGVKTDEGPGDDWPAVHARIMAADIL